MRSTSFFTASIGAIALLAGCVQTDLGEERQPIVNGDAVDGEELPTLGGIATNAGTVCTGTLISPTAVLTAAHCVEPELIKQSLEQAGETPPDELEYYFTFSVDLLSAGDADELLEVREVEWHDEFLSDFEGLLERPGRWHDIAVMHLAEPITDRPVQRLADADIVEALEMERTHLVAGYGQTDDSDPMSAGRLMKGISALNERGQFELIAGENDQQQACRGDSGGPIFADDSDTFQIGVASRINADLFPPPSSPPPCETGLLYTRVDAYTDWITERVDDLGEGEPHDPEDPGDDNGGAGDDEEGQTAGGCAVASGTSPTSVAPLLLAALFLARRPRRRRR